MRHAVGQYYAAVTKVAMDNVVFVWQDTFYTLLVKFREACVRWALDIKLQFARRLHSNLTEGVSKETAFLSMVHANAFGSMQKSDNPCTFQGVHGSMALL